MELTKQDFRDTTDISVDVTHINPIIELRNNGKLVKKIVCDNEKASDTLFKQLLNAWSEVKRGT